MKPESLAAIVNGSGAVRTARVDDSAIRLKLPDPAVLRAVTLQDGRVTAEAPQPLRMNAQRWLVATALFVFGLGCGCALMTLVR